MLLPVGRRKTKYFPMMQVQTADIARLTDEYIRNGLFGEHFDPMDDENWRVLFISQSQIIKHIMKNVSQSIYKMQNNVEVTEAVIFKYYFSQVEDLRMRENYSIDISKSIYEKLPYPSNKGGFEKSFMEFADRDSAVNSFLKINEYYHDFAHVTYIRDDGLLSHYFPDFIVKIDNDIFIVENKADKDLDDVNVQAKRLATVFWLEKVNQLQSSDRMSANWSYVLLGEKTFYNMRDRGASLKEILEYAKMTKFKVAGTLDDYLMNRM